MIHDRRPLWLRTVDRGVYSDSAFLMPHRKRLGSVLWRAAIPLRHQVMPVRRFLFGGFFSIVGFRAMRKAAHGAAFRIEKHKEKGIIMEKSTFEKKRATEESIESHEGIVTDETVACVAEGSGHGLSRRGFLKGGTLAAAGLALAGLAGCSGGGETKHGSNGNLPETWDQEADVVVIGLGAAGAVGSHRGQDGRSRARRRLGGRSRRGCRRHHARVGRHADDPRRRRRGGYLSDPAQRPLRMRAGIHAGMGRRRGGQLLLVDRRPGVRTGRRDGGPPRIPGMPGGESIKTYYVDGICGMSSLWIPLFDKARNWASRSSTKHAPSSSSITTRPKRCTACARKTGARSRPARAWSWPAEGSRANPEMLQNYLASMGCPNAFALGSPYNVGDGVKMGAEDRRRPVAHEQLCGRKHVRAGHQPRIHDLQHPPIPPASTIST